MVTFENAATHAERAHDALRGLAHASQSLSHAADSYSILGSLSAGLISLRQTADQLAGWHDDAANSAVDAAGDPGAGYRHAVMAAARLRQASVLLERVSAEVDAAWAENGRVAWQPELLTEPVQPSADQNQDLDSRRHRLAPGSAFGAEPDSTDRSGPDRDTPGR